MTIEVTIRDVLVPALQAAFPNRGLRVGSAPDPVAVFPAVCAEVGDVEIYDDGDEAMFSINHVTHLHIGPDSLQGSPLERARSITEEVIEYLRLLFDDRLLLWSRQKGQGGGGWLVDHEGGLPDDVPDDADLFVWSRRIER